MRRHSLKGLVALGILATLVLLHPGRTSTPAAELPGARPGPAPPGAEHLPPPGSGTPGPRSERPPPAAGSLGIPAEEPGPTVIRLRSRIGEILRSAPPSSTWSVLAVSLDRGDTLFSRDPLRPVVPASNMKLLTAAAALHHLGPDFRFQTFVLADGPVTDGVLHGDLILYGTGDPAISDRLHPTKTAVLEALAAGVVDRGIREVAGGVVGDASFFRDGYLPPVWDQADLNDWFAAPVSALSFNENVVTLRVEPGPHPGARPIVHTIPPGGSIPTRNEAVTVAGPPAPRLMLNRMDPTGPLGLIGEIRMGGRDAWRVVTVGDPPAFAAASFRHALLQAGVEVRGDSRGTGPGGASRLSRNRTWAPALRSEAAPRVVAIHRSPPLEELLGVLNKESHNLYAELLFRTLGQSVVGDPSGEGGSRAVTRYLAEVVGADTAGLRILDGSGLSAGNRLTVGVLVRLLQHVAETPHWDPLLRSLPEAGNPRELRRMYRTPAAGNLRAKTGTLDRVSALSGVVRSRRGEWIAFAIVGNDLPSTYRAKRIEDRIGEELAAVSRPFERQSPAGEG